MSSTKLLHKVVANNCDTLNLTQLDNSDSIELDKDRPNHQLPSFSVSIHSKQRVKERERTTGYLFDVGSEPNLDSDFLGWRKK